MRICLHGYAPEARLPLLEKFRKNIRSDLLSGIITQPIFRKSDNYQVGYEMKELGTHRNYIVAHEKEVRSYRHAGRCNIDVRALVEALRYAYSERKSIFFLDELGVMQSHSSAFLNIAEHIMSFDDEVMVIATLPREEFAFKKLFYGLPEVLYLHACPKNINLIVDILHELVDIRIAFDRLSGPTKQKNFAFIEQCIFEEKYDDIFDRLESL